MSTDHPDSIRDAVVDELDRRGWSVDVLLDHTTDGPCRATVYHWISGRHAMNSRHAAAILEALGLRVTRTRKRIR